MIAEPVSQPTINEAQADALALGIGQEAEYPLVPRGYQLEGITALVENKRFILADPPSAGKTLQAAEAAKRVGAAHTLVIVGRKYLGPQWRDFLRAQYPTDRVSLAYGSMVKQAHAIARPAEWVIVNIEMLRSWEIPPGLFDCVIIDESHHMRKVNAQQTQAILRLVNGVGSAAARRIGPIPYVFMLTATPIYKTADDLYSQLKCLAPDDPHFSSYYRFVDMFLGAANSFGQAHGINQRNASLLQSVLGKYGWVRTPEQLQQTLPPINATVHRIPFDPKRRKIYNENRDLWRQQFTDADTGELTNVTATNALTATTSLRRLTASPEKLQALIDIVEDSGGPVQTPTLIFTWFVASAHMVADALKPMCAAASLPQCAVVTGEVPDFKRKYIAEQSNLCVATIASISEGVDLSHFRQVIFFEEDYCPGSVFQAMMRVRRSHRIAGTNLIDPNPPSISVHYLLMRNSVDTVIHNTLKSRDGDIESVTRAALLQHDNEVTNDVAVIE